MGTSVDAAILSIGLVRFTVADGVLPYGHGHWHIDLADSLRNGAQADGETIRWWLTQPEASRRALRGLQRREDGHGGMLEADAAELVALAGVDGGGPKLLTVRCGATPQGYGPTVPPGGRGLGHELLAQPQKAMTAKAIGIRNHGLARV
jgi:hypothetical protein